MRKQYYCNGITNNLGMDFDDNIQIMQPITYGQTGSILYNSYAFRQPIWNIETLYGWYTKLQNHTDTTILFSGDTTTYGQTSVDTAYYPNKLFDSLLNYDKLTNITTINSGHLGATTVQWDSTYVDGEITSSPDLWILRWGMNDAIFPINLSTFATALRSGLSKIRTVFPLNSGVGIILMVENSSSDTTCNNLWCEEVQKVIRRASYDYQCCFFDTYALWQNSRNSANLWMDSLYTNPKDNMNLWITSKLYEVVVPSMYKVINQMSLSTTSVNYVMIPENANFYLSGLNTNPEYNKSGLSNFYCSIETDILNNKIAIYSGSSAQWSLGQSNYGTVPICDSSPQTGCLRLKFTPSYNGIADQDIFILSNLGYVHLYHESGSLYLVCKDSSNVTQVNVNLGAWSVVFGTEYEFEFDWDWTSGYARVFIDGTQFGSTIMATFTRGSSEYLILGGSSGVTNPVSYFRNIIFYPTVQHTFNYNTLLLSNSVINSTNIEVGQDSEYVKISGTDGVEITNNLVLENSPITQTSGTVFYCTYKKTLNANYLIGTTSNIATNSGTVQIINNSAYFPNEANWLIYTSNALIDIGQIISLRCVITPNYAGIPTHNIGILNCGTYGTYNNLIELYHENTVGNLVLLVYDSSGIVIVNQTVGVWSPVIYTQYEILINVNVTSGVNQVFINGFQLGITNTNIGVRTSGSVIQVGSNLFNRTYYSNFNIKNFIIYSSAPFTSDYASGYTLHEYEQQMIIRGSSNFSNQVMISNTTDSSSITTGALLISGGLGVIKNINANNLTFSNNSFSFTGVNTLISMLVVSHIGNMVCVSFPLTTAVGSSATYYTSSNTVQSILSDTAPTTDKTFTIMVTDNNINLVGMVIIRTTGYVQVYASVTQGNFTGSGTTGFGFDVSYNLGV